MAGHDPRQLRSTDAESTDIVAVERAPDGGQTFRGTHSLLPLTCCPTGEVGTLLNAYQLKELAPHPTEYE